MKRELTEQEQFWKGDFGNEYVIRNQGEDLLAADLALFSRALQHCRPVKSILELGTNRGLNLRALHTLLPDAKLSGVELNESAYDLAVSLNIATMWHGSLFDFQVQETVDLSLSKGVLIHLAPDLLPKAYEKLYESSHKYILIAEYYNTSPVEVQYRGNDGKLFKRDFAGDMLDQYPDLALLDYGFIYKRDPNFAIGDVTWFLLEKTK